MPGFYGRKVTMTWEGQEIDGVREKGFTINGEAVNVTADSDDGIQRLLDEDAEASHVFNVSGVTRSHVLRIAKATGSIQGTLVMTYENGYTISGTFNIGPYTEGMPYNDASTFDTTFMSTGPVTHTPGS